jgi:hypothetical protein
VLLLLSVLVSLMLGLVIWGFVRSRHHAGSEALLRSPDGLLLGLLALAAFAIGVFLTYLLLTFGGN